MTAPNTARHLPTKSGNSAHPARAARSTAPLTQRSIPELRPSSPVVGPSPIAAVVGVPASAPAGAGISSPFIRSAMKAKQQTARAIWRARAEQDIDDLFHVVIENPPQSARASEALSEIVRLEGLL